MLYNELSAKYLFRTCQEIHSVFFRYLRNYLLFLHAFPTSDPDIKLVFSKQKHLCMVYLDHLLKQRKIAAVITVKYNLPTNLIRKNAIESVQSKVQNNAIS